MPIALFLLITISVVEDRARGQESSSPWTGLGSEPILPRRLLVDTASASGGATPVPGRAVRFQMFGMPAGFLQDPVGLQSDDDNLSAIDATAPPDAGDFPLDVAIGSDNPFFDFRMPGYPGGVGYQRVHTQYQVIGDRFTSMCVGVQAFTPAGLANDGLANGPTVLSPNLSVFHGWESGLAVQGFVGKNLAARAGWTDGLVRGGVQCGVGVQSPLPGASTISPPAVQWFVEALGSVQRASRSVATPTPFLGVIPGLHWRLRDNWWMSSGVVLPVGTPHYDAGKLQITCSWRF